MASGFLSFKRKPKVAVVRLAGIIAEGARLGGPGLSDHTLAPVLEKAFTSGKPLAVALAINSPGGSPVQSALIGSRIRRLAEETKVPALAFVEDLAASGGYRIAIEADEIYVDTSSIVGSIGVVSSSFGFHKLMAAHGVERRLYTSGKEKSLLDPFQPAKAADVKRLKELQRQIHDDFIEAVKARRGSKIGDGADLFSGNIWLGRKAVELGLADGIGHLAPTIQKKFGDKAKLVPYARRKPWLAPFGGMAGEALLEMEKRALMARFGA